MKIALSLKNIAELLKGEIIGEPNFIVNGLNNIENATEHDLTFYSDKKFEEQYNETAAGAVLISRNLSVCEKNGRNHIVVDNAHQSLAILLNFLEKTYKPKYSGISKSSVVHDSTKIGENVFIGDNVVIGENCIISDNVRVFPNVVIYNNVEIGSDSSIKSNAVICDDSIIGARCTIYEGAIIGSDGFGFIENKDGSYQRIPQLGNVIIEDDVEIGANTTVDRAIIGSTIIEKGSKLDNLIQVGHNVRIGENSGIVSQVGLAGSTKLGKRNRIGGQVGFAGHTVTADDVTILAQSGVNRDVTDKGVYWGAPLYDRRTAFRLLALIKNLPELYNDVDEIKKKL